jgi:small subunit ribosomal protein S2
MSKIPNMIFIIDTNAEDLAVKEALKLNIPIVAIVDTNSDPTGINFPIPGNDDARRAINLYCELIKETILDAQKNIFKTDEEDLKKTGEKDLKIETKNEKPFKKELKKEDSTKKEIKKTPKKIAKSIFSKVKSLTSIKKK